MTVSSHTHVPGMLGESLPASPDARATDTRIAWRVWAMLVVGIAALYLLMYNPFWVPGGDSELYIAVARSLAQGKGYSFNGHFVGISPPGWPLLLAGLMKISPTFGFFKLMTIAFMSFALGLWY